MLATGSCESQVVAEPSLAPAGPSANIVLQGPHHQGAHFRQPVGQQQAAPRQLRQPQAAAMPCGVAGPCRGGWEDGWSAAAQLFQPAVPTGR